MVKRGGNTGIKAEALVRCHVSLWLSIRSRGRLYSGVANGSILGAGVCVYGGWGRGVINPIVISWFLAGLYFLGLFNHSLYICFFTTQINISHCIKNFNFIHLIFDLAFIFLLKFIDKTYSLLHQ